MFDKNAVRLISDIKIEQIYLAKIRRSFASAVYSWATMKAIEKFVMSTDSISIYIITQNREINV